MIGITRKTNKQCYSSPIEADGRNPLPQKCYLALCLVPDKDNKVLMLGNPVKNDEL
jgi:hypothetical protein